MKEEERKPEEKVNEEEDREPEDEPREKEEGWYDIREEKVTEEGKRGQGSPKQKTDETKKENEGEKKTKKDQEEKIESEEEERIRKAGDEEEEGEEVYYDAIEKEEKTEENLEEEEKEEKTETRTEKEEVTLDKEEDGNKKKEVGESAMLRNLESLELTKPTVNEIRENSVWKNKLRREDREEGRSSQSNLENMGSRTGRVWD